MNRYVLSISLVLTTASCKSAGNKANSSDEKGVYFGSRDSKGAQLICGKINDFKASVVVYSAASGFDNVMYQPMVSGDSVPKKTVDLTCDHKHPVSPLTSMGGTRIAVCTGSKDGTSYSIVINGSTGATLSYQAFLSTNGSVDPKPIVCTQGK